MTAETTFFHLSDLHLAPRGEMVNGFDPARQLRLVIDRMREVEFTPHFIVISGDLTDDASAASYGVFREFLDELSGGSAPVLLALGNHDDRATFRQVVLDQSGAPDRSPYYHSHSLADRKVIVLDSTIPGDEVGFLGDEQLAWLETELRDLGPEGAVIFLHHCCRLVASPETVRRFLVRDVDALESIVSRHDVRGVLAGHSHQANSGKFGGTLYATAPAVVCQLTFSADGDIAPIAASGFNICQFKNGQLTVQPVIVPS